MHVQGRSSSLLTRVNCAVRQLADGLPTGRIEVWARNTCFSNYISGSTIVEKEVCREISIVGLQEWRPEVKKRSVR